MPGTNSPHFITECSEDEEGNLILPFPEELLEALGWTEGTTLDFDLVGDRLVIREVVEANVQETPGPFGREQEIEGGDSY